MVDSEREWPKELEAVFGEPVPGEELATAFASATSPVGECRVVLSVWLSDPGTPEVTFGRLGELAVRYASRLEVLGVESMLAATPAHAAAFVRAPTRKPGPPSVHTMHLRRTTLRAIYRTLHNLGAEVSDPTVYLDLPSRWFRAQRPLTDVEIHQLRTAVMTRRGDPPPGAVLLALAEAGASTAELTLLRWRSIGDSAVELPGGGRVFARTSSFSEWGTAIVTHTRALNPQDGAALAVSSSSAPPGSQPAQAAMTNRLRQLLRTAELHAVPAVGPRSIRLWGALYQYRETGRIEAAAHVLGMRSLDSCAAAIGL